MKNVPTVPTALPMNLAGSSLKVTIFLRGDFLCVNVCHEPAAGSDAATIIGRVICSQGINRAWLLRPARAISVAVGHAPAAGQNAAVIAAAGHWCEQ
jgi:hypothetical protein